MSRFGGCWDVTIRFVGSGSGFVGRAPELARLGGVVSGVAGGVGGVVLVVGEQGIGKSALLRAGLAGAAGLGCRVGWGVADELGQGFPLGVMVECLGEEGRRAVAGGDAAGGDGGADAGGAGGGGLGGLVLVGDPGLAGTERLLEVVDRLCAVSPVVVVAEDLQWADEASLVVWRRLAGAVGQVPLLVAGSLRPVPGRDDLAGLVRGVAAAGGVVVGLGPLPEGEVAELVAGLAGGRAGRRLAGVLGRAGGNPLYVTELTGALLRGGRVRVSGGVAELVGEPGGVRVPVSLAAAIGERLAVLPAGVMGVLRWAAVLGAEFTVTDLGLVTGWGAGQLAPVVEQAMAVGVLRWAAVLGAEFSVVDLGLVTGRPAGELAATAGAGVVAEAGSRLGFRHGLIRQVLYEGIPASVREALHLQAARSLAGAGASAERVAAQLVAAPEAGGEWLWDWLAGQAGVLAYRAPQVAAQLLRRALGQLSETDPRREVLEAALVTVAFLLVENEEVERAARALLARTADPDRAAEAAWLLAYNLSRTGPLGEAAAVAEQALARPGTSPVWQARLRARQAMTYADLGQWDPATEFAGEALAEAERAGDRFAAGYALHALSLVDYLRRDLAAMVGRVDRALAVIGDDPQTTDLRLLLLGNRAGALGDLDRHAEADATFRQALALAERAGTPRLGSNCCMAAEYYYEVGQWDDALTVLETAAGLPLTDQYSVRVHALTALIAGHRDDWATVEEHLASVQDLALSSPHLRPWGAGLLFQARALAAQRAGRTGEAVAVLAQYLDPGLAEEMPVRYHLLPSLTRLALAAGDPATAAAAARAVTEEAGREPLPVKTAAADVCRGLVAGDPGPVLAAAAYYQSAGWAFNRAQALEDAAVLLAGRGDLAAARAAFREAAGIYADLGADWDLRRADARLRRYGIRRGRGGRRASATQGWEALTPTEVKIAFLVADGRSNPDIAAELLLSRSTVQTHVSHILAKLGARSRAEVIRQALEHAGGARTPS
jgi:DNA-binding CsgD family transcriptional regulator